MLGDDDLGAAFIEVGDDGVAVEGLIGDEAVKGETVDERSNSYRIEAMAGAGERSGRDCPMRRSAPEFGRHAAFGTTDGLALRPPFCALSVAMDFDDGGIDHGVFHVWRVGAGFEKPGENIRFDQSR